MTTAPRFLLLQARLPNDPMAKHELDCFAERCGVSSTQIAVHDLLCGPPTLSYICAFDAVFLGGSGDFYVSKNHLPHQDATLDFLRELVALKKATFGACFGYQCLVEALGGKVIHDPENIEVGTFELILTDSGRTDPLFGALPDRFFAQMGHKDRALRHPVDCINFASSAQCPLQGFRVKEIPIWAVQFHPELTMATALDRFDHYIEGYTQLMTCDERRIAHGSFSKSVAASSLLQRFVALVLS